MLKRIKQRLMKSSWLKNEMRFGKLMTKSYLSDTLPRVTPLLLLALNTTVAFAMVRPVGGLVRFQQTQ